MKKIRTHYDNLKVARNAPPEVIRAAYKTLSKKHYPDKNNNSVESQRTMTIINKSYAVLSDPEARRKHDAWILEQELQEKTKERTQRPQRDIEFPPLLSGKVSFYDLDSDMRTKMKNRASGRSIDQIRIELDGALWSYIWCALLLVWFYYMYTNAAEFRWEKETFYWYTGITGVVSFLLAKNIN